MTEDELRELNGTPAAPLVSFMSQEFKLRDDGLAALIRFARGGSEIDLEAGVPLHVIYRFLEDTILDFGAFDRTALQTRATMDDLAPVVNFIISWYCGRSHWSAMRLIGFIARNLEEVDGNLLRTGGRGVRDLSPREACNLALSICLEGRNEEDREVFMQDLMYEGDAAGEALRQLREFQAQQKAAKEAAEAAQGG